MLYVVLLGSGSGERAYSAHQTWFSSAFAIGLAAVLLTASPGAPIPSGVVSSRRRSFAIAPSLRLVARVLSRANLLRTCAADVV